MTKKKKKTGRNPHIINQTRLEALQHGSNCILITRKVKMVHSKINSKVPVQHDPVTNAKALILVVFYFVSLVSLCYLKTGIAHQSG